TKRVSFSVSLRCSQAKISSIFASTKSARCGFNVGSIGLFLVIKFVKPTKVLGSWPSDQPGCGQFLFTQTQAHIGATATRVLRKADATVRQEVRGLDLLDRVADQLSELLALLIRDGGTQVLDFDQPLTQ